MEKKSVLVNNTFKEFTYWNWDYIPTETDPMQQAIDWLSLAEVVHHKNIIYIFLIAQPYLKKNCYFYLYLDP